MIFYGMPERGKRRERETDYFGIPKVLEHF
jgi:hypothetical protein